jgi:cytoskeleton protein RodZ
VLRLFGELLIVDTCPQRKYRPRPMESLGATFRHARESRKLSLSQVAEATRISGRHLQNIEEGRYGDLPGGMYNRAFIRAYSEFLELDPQALVSKYDTEVTPLVEKKPAKRRVSVPQNSSKNRFHSLLAWTVMLGLSTAGVFSSRHWIAQVFSPYFSKPSAAKVQRDIASAPPQIPPASAQPPAQTAPPPLPADAEPQAGPARTPSAPGTATSQPEQQPKMASVASPAPGAQPASDAATRILIRFEALQKCWASISADSHKIISRQLEPGDEREVAAAQSVLIVLGNAGGVRLTINGKPAKPLGKPGDVVKVTITEQNLSDFLEPTPTHP